MLLGISSDIPEGEDVPDYMISLAKRGPDGPINYSLAQLHLPLGAEILDVELDGKPVGYVPFVEQDRPSLVVGVDLPPRDERELVVRFTEPLAEGIGMAPAQPLVGEANTTIVDREC